MLCCAAGGPRHRVAGRAACKRGASASNHMCVFVQTADLDEEAADTLDLETIELINLVRAAVNLASDGADICPVTLKPCTGLRLAAQTAADVLQLVKLYTDGTA